jgi:hypothetical protein
MMESLPPTFSGRLGQLITILQLIVVATSYANERNPVTRAQYSKFSQACSEKASETKKSSSSTWPSKLAMLVIYAPALITSVVLLVLGSRNDIYNEQSFSASLPKPSIAAYLCIIHFAKRVAEVLFLHHYSGRTDRGTPSMISIFYTCIATLVAYAGGISAPLADSAFGGKDVDVAARELIGVTVFVVGILGNFYHHYLLAKLRSSSSKQTKSDAKCIATKAYIAPRGGLFSHVAAPHYLFELVVWAGIAIVSNHLNVYLAMAGMTSYLAGRSVAQNDFNRKRFEEKDWPRDRKNLVPFIF